jgi:uncharacterized protein (DUF885 family)
VHLEKPLPDGSGIWTGDDAFGFLGRNVNMEQGFVDFEVNRYLGWPGQAPSYKVGERLWNEARDAARQAAIARGETFDLKEFHMRALRMGALGLDVLRDGLCGAFE